MSSLFEEEMTRSEMIVTIRDAYEEKLLLNPPTPAFFATNPKHRAAARHAARRDVDRMLAVFSEMGITLSREGDGAE